MGSIRPDPNVLKKHPGAITQQQIDEKSRFLGTLLGAAAGESLGVQPSYDIDLTLILLRSVTARRRLDLDDVARGYLKWFAGNPKGLGDLTRAALLNLRAGEPPAQSGALAWEDSDRKAAGNGSVTCCAPIGLLHVKNLEGLADDAAAASRITHSDPRCVAGCVAVTTAIALLVRGGKEAEEAIPRAASAAGTFSDDVFRAIERGAAKKPDELQVDGKDKGYVVHAVELAFSALASAANFEDGLNAVISRGGDTDSNGCVAGALLGAKFGKSQVPDKWAAKAAPELLSVGEQLYKQL
jgi:ADP-ribosyl-[dinitrogen reductase] hydrolase